MTHRHRARWAMALTLASLTAACMSTQLAPTSLIIAPASPIIQELAATPSPVKRLVLDVETVGNYAGLSVYEGDKLLVDSLNIPQAGRHMLTSLVQLEPDTETALTIRSHDTDVTLHALRIEDVEGVALPQFVDISEQLGLDKVSSIKYGGPTIADMDQDGDYDLIVNNHNEADSKLYWNNGDGTITAHEKNLSRWFMHDLHGTAAGDYDNDGDLDLVVTMGGGNGTNPSKANFYHNDNGKLILMTGDVGIDRGGRGRAAQWSDMDLDGDLDLMLVNELGLQGEKPQHFFYENAGDGTFEYKAVEGLQDVEPSRVLLTDINSDRIDDIILFGPLSIWQGNGDFTFTDVTAQLPEHVVAKHNVMAIADVDIDNDGDLDLYLANGKALERVYDETTSMDFDPLDKTLSIKPRGLEGVDELDFTAEGSLAFYDFHYTVQGHFRGQEYPIYLGADKAKIDASIGDELTITPEVAAGWPDDISQNGLYFGHIGDGRWKAALVRNGDLFWSFKYSLSGVSTVTPGFIPQNRNEADILLRNDGGRFTDVSAEWGVPTGGNALGVTTGDFNNDSHQDLFVYRWGRIGERISDLMLLNTGTGGFETVTMHGANDVGGPGNGDMGQAFDFDLDGGLDLLNGSEGGEWYLYRNDQPGGGNYALVRVGYAPTSNVDAISAEVTVTTDAGTYRKRVGSAGAVFSQSLLNMVHFGLGEAEEIEQIDVRWRNGETVTFKDKPANTLYDTNKLDPETLTFQPATGQVRAGTSIQLEAAIAPKNADTALVWTSSDERVFEVDANGRVTATGAVGDAATISARSPANGLTATRELTVEDWYARPVQSVALSAENRLMIAGQTQAIMATILPKHADDATLNWSSSDDEIASVDAHGLVMAHTAGEVTIKATSAVNTGVHHALTLTVEPFVEGFIRIADADKLATTDLVVGESVTLNVDYHAGTGHRVIASDEGGMRFWLRHFKYEWIPERDIILTDASVLKTQSGSASMTIPLDGLTPTADLPEGQFYYLRASFASSDGTVYNQGIYPISIVAPEEE